MKKLLALLLVFCFIFSGCQGKDSVINMAAEKISFSIPSNWTEIENPDPSVYSKVFSNKEYTEFLGVISERVDKIDLKEYASRVKKQMAENIEKDYLVVTEETITGEEFSAVRLEFVSEIEETGLYYYVVILQKDDIFNQLLFWTAEEFMDYSKPNFEKVVSSLD
ncbi:MAG: hypothetical protein IKZ25_05860 [Clostridia bacterium]|nr:hypothetical protein [Clostridia bacterium]